MRFPADTISPEIPPSGSHSTGGSSGFAVRGSRFTGIRGLAIRTVDGARPVVRQNVFVRGADGSRQAIDIGEGTAPQFLDNVFAGYTEREIVKIGNVRAGATGTAAGTTAAAARARALLQGNFVVTGRSHVR